MSGSSATKETAAVFTWGMGLHTLQDTYSHGNITKDETHIAANDDPAYNLNEKTGKLYAAGDAGEEQFRYNKMITATKGYIDNILYGDGTEDNPGYGNLLFSSYSDK